MKIRFALYKLGSDTTPISPYFDFSVTTSSSSFSFISMPHWIDSDSYAKQTGIVLYNKDPLPVYRMRIVMVSIY